VILKDIFQTLDKSKRLHGVDCPVIGLTGGIATGKSTVSKLLQGNGLPVICADSLIKDIYSWDETKEFITKNFPKVISNNSIDFKKLREIAFASDKNREALEAYLYQHLPEAFNQQFSKFGIVETIIYDVPLLFEKKLESKFDLIICVHSPKKIQIERLLKRDGISVDLAESILQKQLPIDEKRDRSDFTLSNISDLDKLELEVEAIVALLFE